MIFTALHAHRDWTLHIYGTCVIASASRSATPPPCGSSTSESMRSRSHLSTLAQVTLGVSQREDLHPPSVEDLHHAGEAGGRCGRCRALCGATQSQQQRTSVRSRSCVTAAAARKRFADNYSGACTTASSAKRCGARRTSKCQLLHYPCSAKPAASRRCPQTQHERRQAYVQWQLRCR